MEEEFDIEAFLETIREDNEDDWRDEIESYRLVKPKNGDLAAWDMFEIYYLHDDGYSVLLVDEDDEGDEHHSLVGEMLKAGVIVLDEWPPPSANH